MPAERAVVAFDGSARALRALRAAAHLLEGAEVLVLHVGELPLPPPAGMPFPGAVPTPPLPTGAEPDETSVLAAARDVAEEGVREAAATGLHARALTVLAGGGEGVADKIAKIAEEYDATLIVMGSHGHSALRAALLGSVSMGVLQRTRRPVLVVPDGH